MVAWEGTEADSCEDMRVMWLVTGVRTRCRRGREGPAVVPSGDGPEASGTGEEEEEAKAIREALLGPAAQGERGAESVLRPSVIAI